MRERRMDKVYAVQNTTHVPNQKRRSRRLFLLLPRIIFKERLRHQNGCRGGLQILCVRFRRAAFHYRAEAVSLHIRYMHARSDAARVIMQQREARHNTRVREGAP